LEKWLKDKAGEENFKELKTTGKKNSNN